MVFGKESSIFDFISAGFKKCNYSCCYGFGLDCQKTGL